uniref:Putative site-specific DNA endonuclease n=1 Tax=Botryococcus braunii Showa TaxID=1202541 RepID=A0A167RLT7_BOTBR|nr:putative site-specific DNA endonuclease [Botryococcus braunii Showa]
MVQHRSDIQILHPLKAYFQCKVVGRNHGDRESYSVRNRNHLEIIRNALEMLLKCSRNALEMLLKCSRNALEMLLKCSRNALEMLLKCSRNALILPFFEKHKLKTKKGVQFEKFRNVVLLMNRGEHLTPVGVEKILKIHHSPLFEGSTYPGEMGREGVCVEETEIASKRESS